MSLDIMTTDEEKYFHIGYIGFATLKGYFVLCFNPSLYYSYQELMKYHVRCWYDELDNLQTLCSDCNLNKSDLIQK